MKRLLLFILLIFIYKYTEAQVYGCTDSLANNFNANATANDGSCTYDPVSVTPTNTYNLPSILIESSGLINWNGSLWTHNDSADTLLYELDTLNGSIKASHPLSNITNTDWEEITQDSNFVYIGDFGNNANGNRTDLHILRIDKTSLLNGTPVIDTINFSYADQTNFNPAGPNNTEFDCEAFLAGADSLYLFTKQWISNSTAIYGLPKAPGTYSAVKLDSLNVQGLITGLTYLPHLNLVVLLGYSSLVQPFLYLLYDFNSYDFFDGNKRKVNVLLPFHQTEGISSDNGLKYYVSNEYFTQPPILTVDQKLHIFNLESLLDSYVASITSDVHEINPGNVISVYPNPVSNDLYVTYTGNDRIQQVSIIGISGSEVYEGFVTVGVNYIDIKGLSAGNYFLVVGNRNTVRFSKID